MFRVNNTQYDNDFTDIICETSNYIDLIDLSNINSKDFDIFKNGFKSITNKGENLLISLSGGVDSMVCMYFAKMMGFNVKALMINYLNRETSDREQVFVSWWCNKIGVELFIYRMDNIKRERNSKNRTEYEELTKKIRFDLYNLFENRRIVLGHNRDDCLENIFSNLKKNRSYHNLLGMNKVSNINEVNIIRPILDIKKTEIIRCANILNIPYLYDSTPKWSERGMMRDVLIPGINDFNNNILGNLINYCNEISELFGVIHDEINNLDIQTINNVMFIEGNMRNIKMFWKELFNRVNININNKCIDQLINNYQTLVISKKQYMIGKNISMIFQEKDKIKLTNQ